MESTFLKSIKLISTLALLLLLSFPRVEAHPHVFVDGGLSFSLNEKVELRALHITWLFDEFETLYLLSSTKIKLTDDGKLPPEAWDALRSEIGTWPASFSGSAHLSVAGKPIALEYPVGFKVRMVNTRLELTFTRSLPQPLPLLGIQLNAAFYESSFFYDFSITQPPVFFGDTGDCIADVISFSPDDQSAKVRSKLLDLSREEDAGIPNVGALFADRIIVQCG